MQGRRDAAESHAAPEFSIPPASAALAATLPAAAARRIGPLASAGFTVPPASAGETAHAALAARAARPRRRRRRWRRWRRARYVEHAAAHLEIQRRYREM